MMTKVLFLRFLFINDVFYLKDSNIKTFLTYKPVKLQLGFIIYLSECSVFLAQMNWDSKYFEAIIYCLAIRIDSFCNLSLRLTSYLIIYKIMCVCKQPPSCHFKTLRSMCIEWALDINLCNINGHKKCKNVSNRKAYQTMKVFFYVEC